MFRKALFWSHLGAGVVCGLVILMMSVTGVLLAYERQLIARAERPMWHARGAGALATPLPVASLLANVAAHDPQFEPTTVSLAQDPLAPAVIAAGRAGRLHVDRYTGTVLADSAAGTRALFDTITGWHRWFDADGDSRDLARAVTGASNFAFLFLLLSGAYLWLPPVCNRFAFRVRLLFNPRARSNRARDYNWHHVFGAWSVLPLIVIVASALVFSYPWANDFLFRAVGDTPPARGGGPPPERARADAPDAAAAARGDDAAYDAWLAAAAVSAPGWNTLTLSLPPPDAAQVEVAVDYGTGGQPQKRETLRLDPASAAVTTREPFAELPAGRKARSWVRFLHTGEAFGLAGQTVAGLVSLTSTIMVWTGVALAWRRLVSPLLRRRRILAASR